jgi:hypothetical protein
MKDDILACVETWDIISWRIFVSFGGFFED